LARCERRNEMWNALGALEVCHREAEERGTARFGCVVGWLFVEGCVRAVLVSGPPVSRQATGVRAMGNCTSGASCGRDRGGRGEFELLYRASVPLCVLCRDAVDVRLSLTGSAAHATGAGAGAALRADVSEDRGCVGWSQAGSLDAETARLDDAGVLLRRKRPAHARPSSSSSPVDERKAEGAPDWRGSSDRRSVQVLDVVLKLGVRESRWDACVASLELGECRSFDRLRLVVLLLVSAPERHGRRTPPGATHAQRRKHLCVVHDI
jgi:hypothetical protein